MNLFYQLHNFRYVIDNLENDFSIAIDDNDEDLVEDFEPNENDMESVKLDLEKYRDFEILDNTQSKDETDDWDEKMKVKKPAIRIEDIINKMFEEFYFKDTIGKFCTAEEQSLLMDIYIYKKPYDEAAEVREVSKVAVNNRLKRIYKKLAKSKELKLLFNSMNE